jgi:ABC-type transport system substrate-binding protein/pSer/pThr/pTyr-binding forkhead associated (FHA) protein
MAIPIIVFEDGQELVLPVSERISVGRGDDNHIVADDNRISVHHAEIVLNPDGTVEVIDKNSTAGTWINNQRVDRQIVRPGDSIAFGPLVVDLALKPSPKAATATVTTKVPIPGSASREAKERSDANQAQARLDELQAQISAEKTRLEALQAQIRDGDIQALQAEEKLGGLKTASATVEAATRAISAEHDEKSAALKLLADRHAQAEERLESVQTKIREADTQARQADEKLAELKAALAKHEVATRALSAEHDEKSAALKELSDRQAREDERLKTAMEEVSKEELRLEGIRREAADETERFKNLQNSIAKENEQLVALRSECAAEEARRQEAKSKADIAETSLKGMADALARNEAAKSEMEAAIQELNRQRAQDEANLQQIRDAAGQESGRLEPARRELMEIEERLRVAKELAANEQSRAQASAEKAEATSRESEASLQQLSARRSSEEQRLQQIQEEITQKSARLEDAGKELAQVESRLQEARELDQQREEKARSEAAALAPLHERRQELEASISETQTQLSETNSLLTEEKIRLANAAKQRAELESRLERLRQEIAGAEVGATGVMVGLRRLFFVFPFVILALAWWSAAESQRGRVQSEGGVTAMLSEPMPAFHPYAPRTEAERQIMDLVHEPLMRVGADGALQPALAELWRWSQDVTCWFADAATAKQAQERLQAQIGEKNLWAEWRLSTVRLIDNSLVLNFSDPTHAGTPQALDVIADLRPKNIAFWRVETRGPLKEAAQRFLAESPLASQIHRVWFDHDNAFEIVAVGPSQKLLDELRSFISKEAKSEVRMGLLGEVGALTEPVLDLDMRRGQTWHDGTPVTAYDVKTTIEQVNRRPWLLPNREALRHIQVMDIQEEGNRLHVVFRSRYGPALCGWTGLPVLPASWWLKHEGEDDAAFTAHPPPGAGPFRVNQLDERTLALTPVLKVADRPRFLFYFNASPLMTEIGLGTDTTQLVWPATSLDNRHEMLACLTPPHRRHVVLWNTRRGPLADVNVRKAIAMITEESSIIAALPGKHTLSDASLFPPGMWLHTNAPRITHSPVEAKKLLAGAGWLPGVDGVVRGAAGKLEFSLLLVTGDTITASSAEMLASQWQALGAAVTVEVVATPDVLAQRLAERKFDAVLLEQRFEVSWDQFPWWHSSQAKSGGTNYAGIEDPQTDLLLEALATEFEPAAAADRVRQLETRLLPMHPMLPLFNTVDDAAVRSSLVANQTRTGWTLRQIALKAEKPVQVPAAFELKLPEE